MATGEYQGITSDEIFDFTCSPCAEQKKNREAVRYCVECQDYYCQTCIDMHKMFPAMKRHKLLKKADFKASGQQSSLPQVPTERCGTHMTKLVDMYCRDHDEVGCTSCIAEKHRSCKAVVTVSDALHKTGLPSQDGALVKQLTFLIKVCKRIQSDREQAISDADQAKYNAFDKIKKQRKELDDVLDMLENASKQYVDRMHKKLSSESKEAKQNAKEYETKLQKRVTSLRSSKGNAAQQFVSANLGQKDINEVTDATNTIEHADKICFEFTADAAIYKALSQYKSLGKVIHRTMSATNPTPKKTLYKVKRVNTLNVKLQEDKKTCDIMSCCFFDPKCILLADYDNESLKRVNMQTHSVTGHCDMSSSPIAVCCVNKSHVAVTLDNKTIQFVSIRGHMKTTRQVKLNHKCFGIACKGGKMYVSGGSGELHIYDLSGTLVKTVNTDTLGNNIFTYNRHVTYSSYNDNVYVTDINKGLVCFDKNGKYEWNLTTEMLNVPQCVCSDGKGNSFVCAWNSKNVAQIGSDGKLLGEVVSASSGLGCAWSVCFDKINNRLVVTTSRNNKIFIFDIE